MFSQAHRGEERGDSLMCPEYGDHPTFELKNTYMEP